MTYKKDLTEYQLQKNTNEDVFRGMLKNIRPDLYVMMDLLDNTKVSPIILYHVLRHLSNISNGNKYGTITITIENGVCTFVRGEESNRLNEKVIQE